MANVALVVNSDPLIWPGLSVDDAALESLLTGDGHTVTRQQDATTPDGSFDVYVICESSKGVLPSSTYATLATPVVTLDIGSWDDMSLAAVANDNSATSYRFFDLLTHDITAGITPTADCQVITGNKGMWGTPGGSANLAPDAEIFALHGSSATHTMGFAVDQGGAVVGGGTAPARRVCLAYIETWGSVLTTAGQTLLLQSVDWALAGAGTPAEVASPAVVVPVALPAPTIEVGTTLTGPDLTVPIAIPAPAISAAVNVVIPSVAVSATMPVPQVDVAVGVGVAVPPIVVPVVVSQPSLRAGVGVDLPPLVLGILAPTPGVGAAVGVEAPAVVTPVVIPGPNIDTGAPVEGFILGTLTGPMRRGRQAAGPTSRRVTAGGVVRRQVTGTQTTGVTMAGPSLVSVAASGPETFRTVTGTATSRTVTGSET